MAQTLPPMINGKSNEWADIILNMLGQPFASIQAIEYSYDQAMENVMGAGNGVVSRAYGNFDPKAKITMLMEEVELVQAVAPNGILQRIPEFSVSVVYFDQALPTRTHTLKNCRFKTNGRTVKQGDTKIAVELELIISHIEFV
jgi:hypothetical protein